MRNEEEEEEEEDRAREAKKGTEDKSGDYSNGLVAQLSLRSHRSSGEGCEAYQARLGGPLAAVDHARAMGTVRVRGAGRCTVLSPHRRS